MLGPDELVLAALEIGESLEVLLNGSRLLDLLQVPVELCLQPIQVLLTLDSDTLDCLPGLAHQLLLLVFQQLKFILHPCYAFGKLVHDHDISQVL